MRFRNVLWCSGLAALACGAGERDRGPLADDMGRRVALDHPAQRIVSLSPSTTELLFAIGAGAQVVGRTRWCDFPPEVSAVPSVGDGLNPNLELVLSRRPDLVVFYASLANRWVISRLDGEGVQSASVRLDRLDDWPHAARLLARLAGTERRADSLARAFETRLDSARATHPDTLARVAIIAWDNPPVIIGAGSFLTDLLALAGARNVFDDVSQPSATTTIEAIAARNPDAVMVLGERDPPEFAARPEWRNVGAVARGRFVVVHGSEFERPSLRSFDAVRALRAALVADARR